MNPKSAVGGPKLISRTGVRHPARLDVVEEGGPWRADVVVSVVGARPDPCSLHLLTLFNTEVDWPLHLNWPHYLLVTKHATENVNFALEGPASERQERLL